MSFNNTTKQIHSIDSYRCGPSENWEKNFGPLQPETETKLLTLEKSIITQEAVTQAMLNLGGEAKIDCCTVAITKEKWIIGQEIVQYSWSPRKR
jgi:hypothetical protein